jgi:hypothetical protein
VGSLQVATVANSAAILIGELYVEYDIMLLTPQLETEGFAFGGSITGGGTISAANPLGSVPVQDPQSTGFSVSTGSIITLNNVGTYVLTYSFVGTVITAAPAVLTAGTSITVLSTTSVIDAGQLNAIVRVELIVNSIVFTQNTIDITLTATTVTSSKVDVATVPDQSLN